MFQIHLTLLWLSIRLDNILSFTLQSDYRNDITRGDDRLTRSFH